MSPAFKALRSLVLSKIRGGVAPAEFVRLAKARRAELRAEREECDRRSRELTETIREFDTMIRIAQSRMGDRVATPTQPTEDSNG